MNIKLRLILIKEGWGITCLLTFDFLTPFLMQCAECVRLETLRVTQICLWGTGVD